ncbi:MAG: DUF4861 domain-containing protein [Ferruginibacter sp.]
MKSSFFIKIVLVSSVAFLFAACSSKKSASISIENPSTLDRSDELVVLKRSAIEEKTGPMANGKFVMLTANGRPVLVQYDDMDGDGQWDEVAFLYSFKAREKIDFLLGESDSPATIKAAVRAHVRHIKKNADDSFGSIITKDSMPAGNPPTDFAKTPLPPYLTEGPSWENDKVAFRLYFDTRNGKDVFGKIVPGMVLDTIGANHNNSYHELSNWGMDILHVGKSLGAGAIAIETKGKDGKDTLMRLGGPNVKSETYQVVADGPIRAIFRIKYNWEINGQPVEITDETSIWGGQYYYETKLTISGVPADSKLVAGFANFYDNVPGQIDTASMKAFYSYGPQSENKDGLGLAIAVDDAAFAGYKTLKDTLTDIRDSYAVSQNIVAGKPVIYRFYSGWSKSDKAFETSAGFTSYLANEMVLWHNALIEK